MQPPAQGHDSAVKSPRDEEGFDFNASNRGSVASMQQQNNNQSAPQSQVEMGNISQHQPS
jgi:hypothetical protein